MSWHYPRKAPKSAAGGIRLNKTSEHGNDWWGQKWMDALTGIVPRKQLERGLRYAKSGQVVSVHVEQGFAAVEVQGSRTLPYKVEIGLPMFTSKQWMRVADALLKKAFFTAKLLAGDMPREIEPIFRAAAAPLFPASPSDFSSDCSCAAIEEPCKHVAAACFLLGQEFNRDPFLLMAMRGLSRAQLLSEIQTRRNNGEKSAGLKMGTMPPLDRSARTALSGRLHDFFEAPKDASLNAPLAPDYLERLLKPGERIREMGSPPFWQSDNNFEEVLTKIYQAVRRRALG